MKKQIEISTLDEQKWAQDLKKLIVLDAPSPNVLHCKIGDKFYTFCNKLRGSIAEEGLPDNVYDVCVSPDTVEQLDSGFARLVREKVLNLILVYYAMLDKMAKDGTITEEQCKELKFKSPDELIECMHSKNMIESKIWSDIEKRKMKQ